jgi:hypothetical protein
LRLTMEKETHKHSLMALDTKDKSRNLFNCYTRRGDLYRVFVNWVYMDLSRRDFESLLLKHGLILNKAGEPICPVTGAKEAIKTDEMPGL